MKCVSPISIKTKEGRTHVPCGTCIHCLTKKQQDWSFRLQQELKISKSSCFITLTYDPTELPILETANQDGEVIFQSQLSKIDLQLFMKRLRKQNQTDLINYQRISPSLPGALKQAKIRYYAVGEYGTKTIRPHYHLLLFNLNPYTKTKLLEIWGKGHVDVGNITPKSITYVTKYVITSRNHYYGKRQKPFSTMSKQPGIGNNYIQDNHKWHKQNKHFHIINQSGSKQSMPDYYKNKIFTKAEKENHRLKNEQKIIDAEILQDKKMEKRGDNPYTIRQLKTERKITNHNKKSEKDIL